MVKSSQRVRQSLSNKFNNPTQILDQNSRKKLAENLNEELKENLIVPENVDEIRSETSSTFESNHDLMFIQKNPESKVDQIIYRMVENYKKNKLQHLNVNQQSKHVTWKHYNKNMAIYRQKLTQQKRCLQASQNVETSKATQVTTEMVEKSEEGTHSTNIQKPTNNTSTILQQTFNKTTIKTPNILQQTPTNNKPSILPPINLTDNNLANIERYYYTKIYTTTRSLATSIHQIMGDNLVFVRAKELNPPRKSMLICLLNEDRVIPNIKRHHLKSLINRNGDTDFGGGNDKEIWCNGRFIGVDDEAENDDGNDIDEDYDDFLDCEDGKDNRIFNKFNII